MNAFGDARSRAWPSMRVPASVLGMGSRGLVRSGALGTWRGRLRALLVALPMLALVSAVIGQLRYAEGLFDFRIYRLAGLAVAHGHNPYWSPQSILVHKSGGFVYPAPSAWAMVPFGLLPFTVAGLSFCVLTTAAVVVTLRVLDVRDIRCYSVALAMAPVSTAVTTGTVSTLIACAAALTWRYRERPLVSALALAASLMLKPLLWPVLIWLVATRRLRSAALTVLIAGAGTAAAYAALHINGLESYPALVRATSAVEGGGSFSLDGLFTRLGAPAPSLPPYLVGAVLVVWLWRDARRNERRAFLTAIVATLMLTPIVWVHYFSLLLIPLALGSPRLSGWWWLPVLMWLVNDKAPDATAPTVAAVWVLALLTFAATTSDARAKSQDTHRRRDGQRYTLEPTPNGST
jgi:alpha-1,2-mannosyltransferase